MENNILNTEAFLPRERLEKEGPKALSDIDLLAVILGSGIKGVSVKKLAGDILPVIDSRNGSLALDDLTAVGGIGLAKACLILSALEFARRRIRPEGIKVRSSQDVMPLLTHLSDRKQEHFICISLNGAHEVISNRIVSIGLLNYCQVHPREVFAEPIEERAASIIVAHNHPSGVLEPSREDLLVTKRLIQAGEILGIKLLDHVVFSRAGFYSMRDHGDM